MRARVVKAYRQRALHGVYWLCLGLVYLLCLEGIELAVCVLAKRCVYWVACSARVILKIVFNFVFIFDSNTYRNIKSF